MAQIKLRTTLKVEFTDISGELWREYLFSEEVLPDGRVRPAMVVRIKRPQWLNVSKSGGHRLVDDLGRSHYVPCGWKHLYWEAEKYHFVK